MGRGVIGPSYSKRPMYELMDGCAAGSQEWNAIMGLVMVIGVGYCNRESRRIQLDALVLYAGCSCS